ncbi:hypothetical protein, partial [Parasphingorhabdus sp.]|uniref:hypothetical protein n=1 Tax=Parasphingorhabdus sp. TaxID=2709688 RepID=UPI003C7930CA
FMAEGVMQPDVSLFIYNPEIEAGFDLLAGLVANAMDENASAADTKIKIDLILSALHGIAHNQITISGYPWSDADVLIDQLVCDLF